jgi:hypothetical protein
VCCNGCLASWSHQKSLCEESTLPDLSPLNFENIEAIQTYGRYCCPAVTPQLLSYQESNQEK